MPHPLSVRACAADIFIMAAERGFYDVNPAPSRCKSNPDSILFKGSGDATLTVYGFESWKEFLSRGGRPLTDTEVGRIEEASTLDNFAVGGRIAVVWPEVKIDFAMDDFIGKPQADHKDGSPSPSLCAHNTF